MGYRHWAHTQSSQIENKCERSVRRLERSWREHKHAGVHKLWRHGARQPGSARQQGGGSVQSASSAAGR